MSQRFPTIDLGPLPIELVNAALGCDLAPGIVHFSSANQDHAFARHDTEFLSCRPHVAAVVISPEYIGQSPSHPEGFELVRGISEVSEIGGYILVALTLGIDAGRYMVQSVYPIRRSTVFTRLRKRRLFKTTKTPP